MDRVSIITRTKDRPLLIARSIQSVLKQTNENWLHIIVNDGGNSKTLQDVIDQFSSDYQGRLKLISNSSSLGTTRALNVGMKAAETEYVVTHDDDDSWQPEFLAKSLASLAAHKKIFSNTRGVVCHTTAIHEHLKDAHPIEEYRYSFNGWMKTIALTRLAAGNFIPPISFLFERAVFSEIGFFNEEVDFAEDWEFYLRFLSRFEIAVVPEHLANYHLRSQSVGLYGNTVTAGIDSHRVAGAAIRNDLLRRDMASGKFGLGYLIALASASPLPGNLNHKFWGVRKKTLARLRAKIF